MTQFLSTSAYKPLAQQLTLSDKVFINGQFLSVRSGKVFETTNQATYDADNDIKAAKSNSGNKRWWCLHPSERKAILLRFTDISDKNTHEHSVMKSIYNGKTVSEYELTDIPETIDNAITFTNAPPYGLAGSTYTDSLRNTMHLSHEIRTGFITINRLEKCTKSVGIHNQYTETKTI